MIIQKKAFTMAEVLITLGILGIVTAMTLPSVIKKYRRNVAAVKLEKFYSVMNQAVRMSIAEHGEIQIDIKNKDSANNVEYIEKWYKENITKYIQTIHEEGADKSTAYYKVAFIDGSGFNSYMSASIYNNVSNLYIFYCLNYKICELGDYEGENQFLFVYDPSKARVVPAYSGDYSINDLKIRCYNESPENRHHCTALIEANGWKIPDDYPWIK